MHLGSAYILAASHQRRRFVLFSYDSFVDGLGYLFDDVVRSGIVHFGASRGFNLCRHHGDGHRRDGKGNSSFIHGSILHFGWIQLCAALRFVLLDSGKSEDPACKAEAKIEHWYQSFLY